MGKDKTAISKYWYIIFSIIDVEDSFYVGDAAGRKNVHGGRDDHSDSDIKFARAIGCQFYTPEEFFLKFSAFSKFAGI